MELISGLPEDVARDCLIRVLYEQFPAITVVCKGWNTEIQSPEFRRRRRCTGSTQKILVTAQARFDSGKCGSLLTKAAPSPVYRLSMFEPETGNWSELAMSPELDSGSGLPMFCQIVGVGYDLVVMGGWDPESWKASNSVFVYNFLSATWCRGADMPGGPRTFFACASDQERMVFVAGGHDEEKNALKSALAYDVVRDEWVPLPDMERERDECKAVFQRGATGNKLRVVGGYCTEMQGRFERTAEEFHVDTWTWGHVEEEFLDCGTCPRTCLDSGDAAGRMYMCKGGDMMARWGNTWEAVAKVTSEIRNVACMRAWEGALLLIGSSGFGEPQMGFLLDLKSGSWAKIVSPENYTGHTLIAFWRYRILFLFPI